MPFSSYQAIVYNKTYVGLFSSFTVAESFTALYATLCRSRYGVQIVGLLARPAASHVLGLRAHQ